MSTNYALWGRSRIVIPTCTLLSSTIDVPLGKHLKSEFSGPGSATPWQPFNIPLSCDKDAKINVRIDADADVSSTPGVMTLDSQPGDMAATGGRYSALVSAQWRKRGGIWPGNLLLHIYLQWQCVVKLKARYYQTGSRVIAGIANGTATFTITYN